MYVETRKGIGSPQEQLVRFNLDSKGAIAYLIKSGPVVSLLPLTQEIWTILDDEKITPIFRWVRRDTNELKVVDSLSKKVVFCLQKEVALCTTIC